MTMENKMAEMRAKMTDSMAEMLLEAMVTDSAYEFEGSVRSYIKSESMLKKTRRQLEHEIKMSENNKALIKALQNYDIAVKNKQLAVRSIKNEYLFLTGERKVKPPIDGRYVMHELIKNVCNDMSDEEYEEVMLKINREKRKKRKGKDDDIPEMLDKSTSKKDA